MIGVILAAGMAKRLRPLTDERPKCLLKVGERTLLQRTVDAMLDAGIRELVVVTGYRANMIRDFLTTHYLTPQGNPSPLTSQSSPLTIHFIDNPDYAHNNNIFSLWLTRPYTDGREFLLMDSDILCDPAVLPAVLSVEGSALALNRHELGEEEMKIVADAEGRITEISKTCRPEDAAGESVGIEHMTADYSTALFRELEQMIECLRATHPPGSHFPHRRYHQFLLYRTRHPRGLRQRSASHPRRTFLRVVGERETPPTIAYSAFLISVFFPFSMMMP